MRDEGIFDGDLIGVHRTPDARSGQIVVARIDDEITVKLLKIGKDASVCCRATPTTRRSRSCPTRTSPSKVCTAGWYGRIADVAPAQSSICKEGFFYQTGNFRRGIAPLSASRTPRCNDNFRCSGNARLFTCGADPWLAEN